MRQALRTFSSAFRKPAKTSFSLRRTPQLLQKQPGFLAKRGYVVVYEPLEIPVSPYKPEKHTGKSYDEVVKMRKEHLSPGLMLYYRKPLMITDGYMQYLWDETGRQYLDMFGGIVTVSLGHCHEEFIEAAVEQMNTLIHTTTIYLNEVVCEYAKELKDRLPPHLNKVYFVNSGSEANDLAVLMARMYSGNTSVIALRNGYHGMSQGAMGLTGLQTWKFPVVQGHGVHHAMCPDRFRGPFGYDDKEAAHKYAMDVKDVIEYGTDGNIAGFIAEPIQGVGGTIPLPPGYLNEVYELVRARGGVAICDEVQTGFGRTGTNFWDFQNHDVLPYIVTMAMGIGNGFPMAAVVTTEEISRTLTERYHFNTYGGNPLSCAIGRRVLHLMDKYGTQKTCQKRGKRLMDGLKKLKEKHDVVGDVRGKGLMLGMELVKDRKTKEPASKETAQVFEALKDMGILIGKGGLYGNVFRIKPPMCITEADVDITLEAFDIALGKL